ACPRSSAKRITGQQFTQRGILDINSDTFTRQGNKSWFNMLIKPAALAHQLEVTPTLNPLR
ncbi:MAG: hypothetical protein D6820_18800, partial [Lentisphaerae bacterium]